VRPSTRIAVPVAVLVAVGGTVAWRAAASSGSGGDAADADAPATATAAVERRDLTERAELDGTLGYGDPWAVTLSAPGTITALPPVGSVVDRGQTLVEVDGRPVPLLLGDRPLWRDLGPGVDDGPDVALVEANLVAFGVVDPSDLTVDETWTSATTTAVEDWQAALGLDETGRLGPGSVVVEPAAVRVVDHPATLGSPASGPVLEVGGTTRQVTVELEATRQDLVTAGQAVDVVLPDGTVTTGKVAAIGTVAEAADDSSDLPGGGGGDATIAVTVSLDDATAAGNLDAAPVTVRVVTAAATGVLAVPVDALLALSEGGYAVERVLANGSTTLVGVELGAFADGWVEITAAGDLAEGDEVEVPA
jgi:Putative peptidoglycan binding domain